MSELSFTVRLKDIMVTTRRQNKNVRKISNSLTTRENWIPVKQKTKNTETKLKKKQQNDENVKSKPIAYGNRLNRYQKVNL